jgi:phosphomannomutase
VSGSAATPDPELTRAVRAWIAIDPDATTRSELEGLLARGDAATLHERFDSPLTFGTAGLRGVVGGGPGAMNRLVVRRTAAGVADWVLGKPDGAGRGIVVGRDARHGSAAFARDTVEVASAAGVRVLELDQPLPTPLTAFAVRHFGAAAGVVVTASHNPARDNGYKVYDEDGSQVIPPADHEIEDAAVRLADAPHASAVLPGDVEVVVASDLIAAYESAIDVGGGALGLRIVYTPLHGVGGAVVPALLARHGVDVTVVPEQAAPDPDFPTVAFPNPEEPGALDLAIALGSHVAADLVLANDPDADRLCVAVPFDGSWRTLSGDELGAILGEECCRATAGDGRVVATTIVSSAMLARIAASHGVDFTTTLTGFKWLGRVGSSRHERLVFAYEEALGYAVSEAVADKDGISAALLVCEVAAERAAAGSSLLDALDDLSVAHGVHLTRQLSFRREGARGRAEIEAVVDRLVASPPATLGGLEVTSVEDLERGLDGLAPTEGVRLRTGDRARVVVRPSGTEPKLKAYVEVVTPPVSRHELAGARERAGAVLDAVCEDVAARCDPSR